MGQIEFLHVLFVAIWLGVILAEVTVELVGDRFHQLEGVTRFHYYIDLLFELPLIACVLVTGILLVLQHWPLTTLHFIKIGAALMGMAANLICAFFVIVRYKRLGDASQLMRYTRWVRWTGIGVPFGFVAAYIGVAHFLW